MIRTTTTIGLGLVLTVATLAAAPAAAQLGPHGRGGAWADGDHPRMEQFHERRLEHLTVFLDLNDQQVEQWREAVAARDESRQGGKDEMQGLHEQIKSMASTGKPDATAIGELVIQAHQLMAAREAEREAFHAELMSILTPEQQERFEAMQDLRPERGPSGRHGRHGLRHGGPSL